MSAACPKHDTGGGPCYCPPAPATRTVTDCKRIDGGADCHSYSSCDGCHNAIYEEVAAPAASACGTCHHACDCREHKFAVLIKAALDAAVHLDDMKNCIVIGSTSANDDRQRKDRSGQVVERVHAACEALGVDLGKHEVAA